MDVSEQFAEAVREALGGLTPNQASYKTGVSHEEIRKMRHGVHALDRTLKRFAEGLGADLHKLRVAAGYEEALSDPVEAVRHALKRSAPEVSETTIQLAAEAVKKILEEGREGVTSVAEDFSGETVRAAWARGRARCECRRVSHGHSDPHGKELVYANRGREGAGAWEAHHVDPKGGNTLANCAIYCWPCHRATI